MQTLAPYLILTALSPLLGGAHAFLAITSTGPLLPIMALSFYIPVLGHAPFGALQNLECAIASAVSLLALWRGRALFAAIKRSGPARLAVRLYNV